MLENDTDETTKI